MQLYIDRGQLTPEEAFGHEYSNVITSYIGIEEKNFKHDNYTTYIAPGDTLLLCSDGITDMLRDHEIAEIVRAGANTAQICLSLIHEANEKGGRDNITVVVARDITPLELGPEDTHDATLSLELETGDQDESES